MAVINTTTETIKTAEKLLVILNSDQSVLAQMKADPDWARRTIMPSNAGQIAKGAGIATNWRREGRQCMSIHPELAEDIKLASSDKIDPLTFRTLPYINPMVVFPDGPTFKAWSRGMAEESFTGGLTPEAAQKSREHGALPSPGKWMKLLGYVTYAHGVPDFIAENLGLIVNTDEPTASMLGMLLAFEVLDERMQVVDYEEMSVSVPNYGDARTLKEYAQACAENYRWSHDTFGHKRETIQLMGEVMKQVLGSVLYLCSTVTEVERVSPKVVAKYSNKAISRKPLSLYKVGWTTGAALSRIRAARTRAHPSEQTGLEHQQQDPQHRKAHFKNQPCGPGNRDRKLIFVSPYWTKKHLLGEYGINIARKVI